MKKTLVILLTIAIAAMFCLPALVAAPTNVGPEKCKMCHKVQFESWSASKHNGKIDCEGCHGPGSDYKAMSVMKDPAAAKAAGLVNPTKEDCGKCHKAVDDAFYAKVHAHKAK